MANEDKARYEREAYERDLEVAEEQARKRREREETVLDSRMRDRPAYEIEKVGPYDLCVALGSVGNWGISISFRLLCSFAG